MINSKIFNSKIFNSNILRNTNRLVTVIGFIYLFTTFTNGIPQKLHQYLSNLFIQFIMIVVIYGLYYYDKFIGTLGFIIFILQFRFAYKEYFANDMIIADDLKKGEIMKRIKASLEFKYNKPEDTLTRETILKIYNKFIGIDELAELKKYKKRAKLYKIEKS